MARQKKDDHFIKKPIFPGGLTAMREIIKSNMVYPKTAKENKIEGSVYLRYGIDYKGNVSEVKILQGLGYGCDEEAERLVRLFKFKVPKTPRKLRVAFHKTIRIHFKIPKQTKVKTKLKSQQQAPPTPYSYTIIPNKSSPEAPSEKKSSYTYTIKF